MTSTLLWPIWTSLGSWWLPSNIILVFLSLYWHGQTSCKLTNDAHQPLKALCTVWQCCSVISMIKTRQFASFMPVSTLIKCFSVQDPVNCNCKEDLGENAALPDNNYHLEPTAETILCPDTLVAVVIDVLYYFDNLLRNSIWDGYSPYGG